MWKTHGKSVIVSRICGFCALLLAVGLGGCSDDDGQGNMVPGGGSGGSGGSAGSAGSGGAAGQGGAGGGPQGGSGGVGVGGGSGGSGSGSGGTGGVCESQSINTARADPEMMIVLDRSGSMEMDGRWQPSVDAVKTVVQELQDSIYFGLTFFPSRSGTEQMRCVPGEVTIHTALNNGGPIVGELDDTMAEGGTPTGETLQGLADQWAKVPAPDDMTWRPQYVLLVTDGQPTCPAAGGTNIFDEQALQQDLELANQAVDALSEKGVTTYVIGYNTANDQTLASNLDGFAQRGGTGQHIPVENAQALQAELNAIAGQAASCTYTLDEEPDDPRYVRVTIDDQTVPYDDPNGWRLDGRSVALQGSACDTVRDGRQHIVDVVVECNIVTVE